MTHAKLHKSLLSLFKGKVCAEITPTPHAARRSRAGQRGATAVEFGLIATPFFFLVFAFFEIMLVLFLQVSLDSAVTEESRIIRTGQGASGRGIQAAAFRQSICNRLMNVADCNRRLFVLVQSLPEPARLPTPEDDPDLLKKPPFEGKTTGEALVVVRAYYYYPLFTPGLAYALKNTTSSGPRGNLGNKNRLMVSVSIFRNEPFK
ncbi:MAG: hypothetical protein RL186_1362 [Pseudomonadota bacterium]